MISCLAMAATSAHMTSGLADQGIKRWESRPVSQQFTVAATHLEKYAKPKASHLE
jgi:hypothetical protein